MLYSPNGKYLVTLGYDQSLSIWHDLIDEKPRSIRHSDSIYCLTISPDGRFLATGSQEGIAYLYEMPDGHKQTEFLHTCSVSAIAFSNDSHLLITGCDNGDVHIWMWESGNSSLSTHHHPSRVNAIAVSPHGNRLATTSDD